MTTSPRSPIRVGSPEGRRPGGSDGEPILLLHPFMLSQRVWDTVAQQLADTGRYDVFAPTMAGHNGGARPANWFMHSGMLADDVERHLDEIGWDTCHVVGNSLGGWVAFELERRGRARTLTAIAPAGGWTRYTPAKFEVVGKFLAGIPLWVLARTLGPRALKLPLARRISTLAISATPDGVSGPELVGIVDDVAHCPAYFQMLVKALLLPGLAELAQTTTPTNLVLCEKDRVLPNPRCSRQFIAQLPTDTRVSTLEGVGHIPMYEAPGRVTEVIDDFVRLHLGPRHAESAG